MDLSTLLIALLVLPLFATLIMAAMPARSVPQSAFEGVHVVSIAGVFILSLYLVVSEFTSGQPIAALNMWFRLDALSSVFVTLIGIIGALVGVFSIPYIQHDVEKGALEPRQVKNYYSFFSLFLFTMLLAATSNNIIMMWICIEATTLATVFLVGCYETKLSLEAAWKYVIVCTAGVAFGLYGTLLLYSNAVAVLADPSQAIFWTAIVPVADKLDPTVMAIAFTFAVVGFGTKAGLFPMHTWLPDAHSEAPSPVSALLSGVLLKCAVLVIIRFYIIVVGAIGNAYPQTILIALGILSVVIAAGAVFVQNDLKRKLAYHSCENIGIVILALGFGGPIGIAAALLHCIFHGLTKALLFCMSGNILMKYGTRDLTRVTGILRVAPATAVLLTVGFFGLAGFPPFAMFVSEIATFAAGWQGGYFWILVLFALALTVVVCACVHVVATSVFGKAPENMPKKDVPIMALVPELILAISILWFGVATPQPILTGVDNAVSIVMQQDVDPGDAGSLLAGVSAMIEIHE